MANGNFAPVASSFDLCVCVCVCARARIYISVRQPFKNSGTDRDAVCSAD